MLIKKIIIAFIFLVPTTQANACIFDPFSNVAAHPDEVKQEHDIAFFGKLESLINDYKKREQTAYFSIVKIYKSDVLSTVKITNKLSSSCSRPFGKVGSVYYVYADKMEKEDGYEIDGYASFVSFTTALEADMNFAIEVEQVVD